VARPKGPPGRARQRVLDAALELFAEHGVSGTSLQMIADRLGLTKAAVYHQFPAKEDIAVAILRDVHTSLEGLVLAAEGAAAEDRYDVAVTGIVELVVRQRRVMSALYRDPEMERLAAEDAGLSATRERLGRLVEPAGDGDEGLRRRLGWSVVGAGFTRTVVDPQFRDVPDDLLQVELVRLAHQILD
jgi:AcrR family transcriptional regulator